MRYLVTMPEYYKPFLTDWFDVENHFNIAVDMIVYDLDKNLYTCDGESWEEIEEDHL